MQHVQSFTLLNICGKPQSLRVNSVSSVYFVLNHNSQISKQCNIVNNNFHASDSTRTNNSYFTLSFSIMYKLHTGFKMQLLVQTYIHTCSHQSAVPVFHWEAQRTDRYIHKFLKEKTAVTRYTCTSVVTILTTFIATCVHRGHSQFARRN